MKVRNIVVTRENDLGDPSTRLGLLECPIPINGKFKKDYDFKRLEKMIVDEYI